jgi:hypothetical protein
MRPVNLTHPTSADLLDYAIVTEGATDEVSHFWVPARMVSHQATRCEPSAARLLSSSAPGVHYFNGSQSSAFSATHRRRLNPNLLMTSQFALRITKNSAGVNYVGTSMVPRMKTQKQRQFLEKARTYAHEAGGKGAR